MASKTVYVPNIHCNHCTKTIEREISQLKGVVSVKTEVGDKTVTIEWHDPPLVWAEIVDLLTEIGYPAQT